MGAIVEYAFEKVGPPYLPLTQQSESVLTMQLADLRHKLLWALDLQAEGAALERLCEGKIRYIGHLLTERENHV